MVFWKMSRLRLRMMQLLTEFKFKMQRLDVCIFREGTVQRSEKLQEHGKQ